MATPIVVVHNDSDLRDLVVFSLRAAGHSVTGFQEPLAALDVIEADLGVRVLVTRINFGTGKLNGVALARILRIKRPGVKTVFVGRPENAEHADGLGEFLPLPLNADHLTHVVGRLLSESEGSDPP